MYKPQKLFWEEKFSTGEPNLDFQHKYLFETFNKLGDAIAEEQGVENIKAILGRLKFYADWHFAKEEECFDHYKCPSAQVNKNAHTAFKDMFSIYHEEYFKTGGSHELAIRVHESLADWLTKHILVVDTSLHACIHKMKE
jgi:hemerythrin